MFKKLLILLVISAIFPIFSLAQTAEVNYGLPVNVSSKGETLKQVNCFDYYNFGAVKVSVFVTNPNIIVPGGEVNFSGDVVNTSKYHIVDGAVYVKIFKRQDNSLQSDTSKDFLVEQFYAVKGLNVSAGKQAPITFSWKVPNFALSGDYYLATYFVLNEKFNLSGISYTDDVIASGSNFSILGNQREAVILQKSGVKVNGVPYDFSSYSPRVKESEPVKITYNLKNQTNSEQRIYVTYTLYAEDGLNTENILNTSYESFVLAPGDSKEISYVINNGSYAAYYVVAEAKYKDAKSIIGVRIVRKGINQPRINFVTMRDYPTSSEEDNAVVACVSNITDGQIAGDKFVLSVSNPKGQTIYRGSYEGPINGAMLGLAGIFKSSKIYDLLVKAEIFQGDKLIDQALLPYSCKSINPENCGSFPVGNAMVMIIAALLAVGALAIFLMMERRRISQTAKNL